MRSDGQFTGLTPEQERNFVAARARGLAVTDAATEAGISRASGYRLDRRVRASAAAAAPSPPVPTVEELAAAEAERDQHRKAKSAERSRRARAKKAEHAAPKPERKRRAIPGSETSEEFIARRQAERNEERENPRKYLFRWSQIKTTDMTCNYDHQDFDDCTHLATGLIERGDVALPRDVLVAALKANDPYDYAQPLDLDAYTAKYIQENRQAAKPGGRDGTR